MSCHYSEILPYRELFHCPSYVGLVLPFSVALKITLNFTEGAYRVHMILRINKGNFSHIIHRLIYTVEVLYIYRYI
jgi:hypothetical protein